MRRSTNSLPSGIGQNPKIVLYRTPLRYRAKSQNYPIPDPPLRYRAILPIKSYTGPLPSGIGQYAYKLQYRTPLPLLRPKMRLQTTISVQNDPQNGPKWPLRALWARQGPFWVILGTILELRCQQHSQMCFGVFWSPFGGLLGGYGALFGPFGDNLGLS